MGETLGTAFSAGGLAQQAALLLLVLGVMAGNLARMRALAAGAALLGLAHSLFWTWSPVFAFWWGLLLIATSGMLIRRLVERQSIRFNPDEEQMVKGLLAGLSRSRARHMLDQGFWLNGRQGDTLTRENEPVTHLYYLSEGEARVLSQGKQVGTCRPGDLVGEVTILSNDKASATVELIGPARFWCAPATVLRPYLETHDDVRRAIESGFSASLRTKLRASNQRFIDGNEAAA